MGRTQDGRKLIRGDDKGLTKSNTGPTWRHRGRAGVTCRSWDLTVGHLQALLRPWGRLDMREGQGVVSDGTSGSGTSPDPTPSRSVVGGVASASSPGPSPVSHAPSAPPHPSGGNSAHGHGSLPAPPF